MFSAREITSLFRQLSDALGRLETNGELYLVGGAVMCLAHQARPSTADVDGYFVPAAKVREAARLVAEAAGVDPEWLNDGVKGYLSDHGEFMPFLELAHLRVMVARPEYLLAMKCLALRLGEEFHDLDDVRFLLRLLNIKNASTARAIVTRYYPADRFPPKAIFVLEELLGG